MQCRTLLNQNIFFSWEVKQKIIFLSCGTEIHFSIKTIHWLLIFSSAIFLFIVGDSIIFFSEVVEVSLYWPTPFLFPWIAFYIKYSNSCFLCVCWNWTAKRRYIDYILYQDAICNWSSSNFVNQVIIWINIKLHLSILNFGKYA
jgi:hypothetical protein